LILFAIVRVLIGLRVSAAEELGGLDVAEHGSPAYADFQLAGMYDLHPGQAGPASRPEAAGSLGLDRIR